MRCDTGSCGQQFYQIAALHRHQSVNLRRVSHSRSMYDFRVQGAWMTASHCMLWRDAVKAPTLISNVAACIIVASDSFFVCSFYSACSWTSRTFVLSAAACISMAVEGSTWRALQGIEECSMCEGTTEYVSWDRRRGRWRLGLCTIWAWHRAECAAVCSCQATCHWGRRRDSGRRNYWGT